MQAVARLLGCEVSIAFDVAPAVPASNAPGPPATSQVIDQQAEAPPTPPTTLAAIVSTRSTPSQPSLPPAVLEYLCQSSPTRGVTIYVDTLPAHVLQAIQESHVRPSTCLAIVGAVSIQEPMSAMTVPQLEFLSQPSPIYGLTTYMDTLPAHGSAFQAIQESRVRPSMCLAIVGAVSIKEPTSAMTVPQQPWARPAVTGRIVSSTILIDPRVMVSIKVSPSASHQACVQKHACWLAIGMRLPPSQKAA